MFIINEDKRTQLVADSKRGKKERDGLTRYQKRLKSKVANSVKEFNRIDMNELFKNNIITISINVRGETDNYLVKISYGGFLDALKDELRRTGKEIIDLRLIIRALIIAFNKEDVYISCSCLHPDTKIKLLDGSSPTVAEMKTRFDKGETLYVYSVDEKGDFKPGKVEKVWVTKTTKDFIKITLDNNQEILTTPDHLYMLRDGSYEQAQNLKINQSLMPLYTKIIKVEKITLEDTPVYDIKVKDYHNFLTDAGVILHNCSDFFYRFGYWATINNINSGEPQLIPSDETNPNNDLGPGCKHVMLVLSNTSWLIKVASVINNYIKYMLKYREKQYADIIYPAIYGKKYEKPVQQNIFDDEMETDTETIDKSNEEGRVSGRFSSENQPSRNPSIRKAQERKNKSPEEEEVND